MKIYIINPAYLMRRDGNRVLIVSKSNLDDRVYDYEPCVSLVHPMNAKMLSFFNGIDDYDAVLKNISNYFNIPIDGVKEVVSHYIENDTAYGISYNGNYMIFPKKMIIEKRTHKEFQRYKTSDFNISGDVNLGDSRLQIPTTINLELTMKCYTDCIYCYANRKMKLGEYLSVDRIISIIREAKQLGVIDFEINGGEVLLHPHYKEVINELLSNGYTPYISTKVPISKKIIDDLSEVGLNFIQISLDSINPDILSRMVGTSANYITLMEQTFRNLEEKGINVKVHSIITSLNSKVDEIENLVKFVSNYSNVKEIKFTGASYSLYKNSANYDMIRPSNDFMKELELHLRAFREKYPQIIFSSSGEMGKNYFNNKNVFNNRSICTANLSGFVILPDGQVTICEELYDDPRFIIGNIREQSILDVWNSPEALSLFNQDQSIFPGDSPCKNCATFKECRLRRGACWKLVFIAYGKDKLYYPDPRCPKAPNMQHEIYFK